MKLASCYSREFAASRAKTKQPPWADYRFIEEWMEEVATRLLMEAIEELPDQPAPSQNSTADK
jgi:hypothetical protein